MAPDDFTAARNALVKRLRAAGEREAARTAAGLRRPKLAAWAVNQVVRADPAAVEALVEAGAAVGDQQRRLLAGVGVPRLREASAARRAAVERLVAEAVAVLERLGVGPQAHVAQIPATWEAASADENAAQQVLAGRLSSPLSPPSGLGELSPLDPAADEEEGPEPDAPPPLEPAGEPLGRQTARRRDAQAALTRARAAVDDVETARTRARRGAGVDASGGVRRQGRRGRRSGRDRGAPRRGPPPRCLRGGGARADRARAELEVREQEAVVARRSAEEAARALEERR